ncbi:MAG: hypothetical protein GX811_01285 [Lentisphaerae bacterium]|nr:hypothetical protein [Lentisphaerota bacterium]
MAMKPILSIILICTSVLIFTTGCDKSRLDERKPITSASVAVIFDGSPERFVDNQTVQEIIPSLAKATHQHHSGSPHPRLKYRLRIEQQGIVEHFYFLDDFEPISCTLPSQDKVRVAAWMRENAESEIWLNGKELNKR